MTLSNETIELYVKSLINYKYKHKSDFFYDYNYFNCDSVSCFWRHSIRVQRLIYLLGESHLENCGSYCTIFIRATILSG